MLVGGGACRTGSIPYGVECCSKICEAKTQRKFSKDDAINLWNKRQAKAK